MRVFVPLVAICLLLAACGDSKPEVLLDNPTDTTIRVVLGEEEFTLSPGETQLQHISEGYHPLAIYWNDSLRISDTVSIAYDVFLNAAQETYVIWRDVYGKDSSDMAQLNLKKVRINGPAYYGDLSVISDTALLVEKDWDIIIGKPFPEDYNFKKGQPQVLSKLFRLDKFQQYYVEYFGLDKEPQD